MIAALETFRSRFPLAFYIEVIDIDRQPALEAKWGDKVPVLLDANREICHYYLDEAALRRAVPFGKHRIADPADNEPDCRDHIERG